MINTTLLAAVRLSAKIDYISFTTDHRLTKRQLSAFAGRAIHPQSLKGTVLTIHDPARVDIELAAQLFPGSVVVELEIAVDFRPSASLSKEQHLATLTALKADLVSNCLKPALPPPSQGGFRGTYTRQPDGYSLRPFNLRMPELSEQLLYGRRKHPAQTKVYHKHRDQGCELKWHEHVIRVEVRLSDSKLIEHGLLRPLNLIGFHYRRELMPYLRHVRGTSLRSTGDATRSSVFRLARQTIERHHQDHWERFGVGAFLEGGIAESTKVRFRRFTEMNNRIGQALTRLEYQFAIKKRVRPETSQGKKSNAINTIGPCETSHV